MCRGRERDTIVEKKTQAKRNKKKTLIEFVIVADAFGIRKISILIVDNEKMPERKQKQIN